MMMKLQIAVAFMAAVLVGSSDAYAQNTERNEVPEAAGSSSRYELRRHEDGYLRLDRQTGAVSLCRIEDVGLVCRLGAREREAYVEALDSMQQQLDELRDRVEILETHAALAEDGRDEPQAEAETGKPDEETADDEIIPGSELTKREIDRAVELTRRMMRPLFDAVQDLKRELENEQQDQ